MEIPSGDQGLVTMKMNVWNGSKIYADRVVLPRVFNSANQPYIERRPTLHFTRCAQRSVVQ